VQKQARKILLWKVIKKSAISLNLMRTIARYLSPHHIAMARISTKSAIIFLLAAGITIVAFAQDKDKKHEEHRPVNLKVLSKDIGHDSLINLMKEYSVSLGVHCNFCHASSGDEKGHLDFASDDNKHKKVARYMMRMTADINSKYFAEENKGDHAHEALTVSCFTCHHGHEEPEAFVMPKEEEKH
jgi:hypothetical protein